MSDIFVVPAGPNEDPRITTLKNVNEVDKQRGKKTPWEERYKVIREQFPSIASLDWSKVFSADPVVFGKIINDIIKADTSTPGKAGKRPSLDSDVADAGWTRLRDEDYALEPFVQVFNKMKEHRSVSTLANKTGLNRSYVFKLLKGDAQPSVYDMQQIAKAFGKMPSFFMEYRVAYLCSLIVTQMDKHPEASIVYYTKTQKLLRERDA